jgi:hypothetical protein
MLGRVGRSVAVLVGALVFCYPAYALLRNYQTLRARSPRAAAGLIPVIVGLSILYGAVVVGGVLHVRHVRRVVRAQPIRGRDVFIGGLQASVVMFLIGFFGPFLYGWITRTEVGNLTPIVGVFALLIGAVLSVAVGLISYGVAVPRLVPDKGPRVESGGLDLDEKGGA